MTFQYIPVAFLVAVFTDITQAAGQYCYQSNNPHHAKLWVSCTLFVYFETKKKHRAYLLTHPVDNNQIRLRLSRLPPTSPILPSSPRPTETVQRRG